MIPAAFDYVRAASVDEAIAAARRSTATTRSCWPAGRACIPMMKLRFAAPQTLIDIRGIPGLAAISVAGGRVDDRRAGDARRRSRPTRRCARRRRRYGTRRTCSATRKCAICGTIGGSRLARRSGRRLSGGHAGARRRVHDRRRATANASVPASRFFRGMFETALGRREIVTAVSFEAAPQSAYVKFHASGVALRGRRGAAELDARG